MEEIPYWQIAEMLNVSETSIYRMLRTAEVSEERADQIMKAIKKLKALKGGRGNA